MIGKIVLKVDGISCQSCIHRIEKSLNHQLGIINAKVNFATEKITIEYFVSLVDINDIKLKINDLGYEAYSIDNLKEVKQNKVNENEITLQYIQFIISIIFSFPFILSTLMYFLGITNTITEVLRNPYFQLILATPVQYILGWQFYKSAFIDLRNGNINIDVLIVLVTSSIYFYSLLNIIYQKIDTYFEISVILIILIIARNFFRSIMQNKSINTIENILELQENTAKF